jgi:3-hydroxymyristoyl/3-hydroxydecanoyl-(acyl carrier protein) dehydratase
MLAHKVITGNNCFFRGTFRRVPRMPIFLNWALWGAMVHLKGG